MKKNLSLCCLLIHFGIVLQSGYGDSIGKVKEPESSSRVSMGAAISSKMEELHEKSSALVAAIYAKIEAIIEKAKPSKKQGSCFLKIKCSQAEFNKLVGNNITILSVDDFNQKTTQHDSLMTPSWWVPTTEMSTNFMLSKNFQQIVEKGHAFALYDKDHGTALFYFDWKPVAENPENSLR